jgi:hypothetical protein
MTAVVATTGNVNELFYKRRPGWECKACGLRMISVPATGLPPDHECGVPQMEAAVRRAEVGR